MSSPLEFRVLFSSSHAAAASSSSPSPLPYTTIVITTAIYHHRHHRCHIPPSSSPLPSTTIDITTAIYHISTSITPIRVHLHHRFATSRVPPPYIYPPPVRVPPDSSPPPVLVQVQYFVTLFWISRSRDSPSRDRIGLPNF